MWSKGEIKMNFFTNFIDEIKRKKADLDERRAFGRMVDEQARPIKRMAYMKEALIQAVKEGKEKAKQDSEKKIQKIKRTPQDFGFAEGLANPYKFLDQANQNLTPPKTKPTKLKTKKKK